MVLPASDTETRRLAVLDSLAINFDAPIAEIQSLCELAAASMGSQIALVSLVKKDEQQFAASVGLDGLSSTPRGVSFCAHAIADSGPLVVEDATRDPRFCDNPLVTGAPGIRSYAATPLEPEPGMRVGTLCVGELHPRRFTQKELATLAQIGGAVTALLLAHRDRIRLRHALKFSQKREELVQRIANTDGLTGLVNAASFRRNLEKRLKAGAQNAAVVLMDADRFKLVNDRYGHSFGDRYLATLAKALKKAMPERAEIGRLGGDEFGMFVEGEDARPANLKSLLERCSTEIFHAAMNLGKPDLGRVSFGASLCPQHGQSYEELYQVSDVALYAAKESGRAQAVIYDETLGDRFNLRALRNQFEAACRGGAIHPYYQPKIDLATGGHSGFEVLCRWDHPQRGLLAPGTFAALLSDHYTAPMITNEILRRTCENYRDLRALGLSPGRLAVNLTCYDLSDPEFADDMEHYLVEAGLSWQDVSIEVTETVVMGSRDDQVYRAMGDMRQRGASIALDDFGTG